MTAATSVAGAQIVVTNPANGKELGRVTRADAASVDRTVRSAANAFSSWSQIPVVERTRRFFKLQVLLEEHLDELAALVANENGKMIADARGEVRRGIECVEFACGMPSLLMGDSLEGIARGIDSHTIRQPLGVCVGITPFNFPAMIPAWMFPIAIAAGNTFILKPSPQTPLSAERLVQLFNQCGFPEGVLQIVHGDANVVESLIKHELTAAVSFVGSTAIARRVQSLAVEHHKRVTALGGAKNFLIVMPDGVNEATLDGILGSAFGAAGERCLAGSVVIAVGDAGDKLVPMLQNATSNMKVAAWDTDGAQMGPVISEQARTRIVGYIENGLRTSELVADGRKNVPSEGTFVGPTIFDRVDPTSPLARDEIFRARFYRSCASRRSKRESSLRIVRHTAMLRRSSRKAADPRVRLRIRFRPVWSASISASLRRWRSSRSAESKNRFSATCACTAKTASPSTRNKKSSSRAGELGPSPHFRSAPDRRARPPHRAGSFRGLR